MDGPRGHDGGKKVKGRKRHLLVDTHPNLLNNKVHPADIHARAAAEFLLESLQHLYQVIEWMRAEGLVAQHVGLEAVHSAALVERRCLEAGGIRAANTAKQLSGARAKVGG